LISTAASPVALTARVDEREALRYLGMKATDGPQISPVLRLVIDRMVAWAVGNLHPLGVHATHPILVRDDQVMFAGTAMELTLQSRDLARLLRGCELATIVAVTLGRELDDQVTLLSDQGRVADAAILDAVGSDCVEQAVDELCAHLASAAAGNGLATSERYSPGYGDLDLASQPAIVAAVGGATIGISVLPSLLMMPLKSVTAVFGWRRTGSDGGDVPHAPDCQGRCARCAFDQCRFRRSNTTEGSRAR
jgi:hypothetical protein